METREGHQDTAILVGLGSIGKNHLTRLLRYFSNVVVIDPNPNSKQFLEVHYPHISKLHYNDLNDLPKGMSFGVAVIANWGPDHFFAFQALKNMGVNRFIIEKPLVSRISDLYELRASCKDDEIQIEVNMPWLYSTFAKKISQIQHEYEIGPISNISVSGGAKCMATNGIHYLGLACSLFETNPVNAFGIVSSERINPRSKDLEFLEGSASWKFESGKILQVAFSNSSHVQALMIINFKFGRIIVESNNATLYCFSSEDKKLIDKPARTFYPKVQTLHFNPFVDDSGHDGTDYIYNSIINGDQVEGTEKAFASSEALLAMLLSSRTGKIVQLPISHEVAAQYYNFDWNIS
jgi:predicted dehydrogenase